jgi:plasmid stabilization system protein ParE
MVAEYPRVGRPVDQFGQGAKCFPAGRYLVYYRKTKSITEIMHVFHGLRDHKRAFRKPRR